MTVILDSSAVLAVINSEPGAKIVKDILIGGSISATNFSEVIAKLVDSGLDDLDAIGVLDALALTVHPGRCRTGEMRWITTPPDAQTWPVARRPGPV